MLELRTTTNIFELPVNKDNAVCITTNSIIKRNGYAVMGAGIAKEADNRYHLGKELAEHLQSSGNVPHVFNATGKNGCKLISFPTKFHWQNPSLPKLIQRSAELLVELCNANNISKCYLTPPGCGCGGLDWETQVKPILAPILDDHFVVVFLQK